VCAVAACQYEPPSPAEPTADGPQLLDDGAIDDAPPEPFLEGFTHRKSITLLASKIEAPDNGDLANFPVLVSLDDSQVAAGITQADGGDITFTAADAVTPLAHELEAFEGGRLVAWVKIPVLSATVDTKLYLYYGNPTPLPSIPEQVWTESFRAVYHLGQDPTAGAGAMRDATASNFDGTAEASMTTADSVLAHIGRGIDFDGSNDCIELPTLDVGNAFTISMWIDLNNVTQIRTLISNSSDGNSTNGFRLFVNTNGTGDRRVRLETGNGSQSDSAITPPDAITSGQWTHVAAIVDRTGGSATVVINGAIANAGDTSIRTDFSTNSDLELGRMETNNPFSGALDEIVIASTTRPLEWIQTAFNNQQVPGDFYVIGTEESR
jgi:hypothetical protein